MNIEQKNKPSEADKIIEEAKNEAKLHSPNTDSQYAFLSGYLMTELRIAYDIIENARDELKIVQEQLNSIGEI